MICANCKTDFIGANFGIVDQYHRLKPICSKECRAAALAAANDPANPPPGAADNAGNGVGVRNARNGVARSAKPKTPAQMRKAALPRERDVSKAISDRLFAAGVWHTRTQSGNIKTMSGSYMQLCRPGTPDRIAAVGGVHVWIEVKAPGKKATLEQRLTATALKENGTLAFTLDNPDDLDIVLKGIKDNARAIATANVLIRDVQLAIDQSIEAARRAERGKK